MPSDPDRRLLDAALAAREHAHAPFSGFKVGAALAGFNQAGEPAIFAGCNIENASYGLTVCAERVAIWKAVSEGARRFQRIAIVADSADFTPPCGACRQIVWEFCGDIPVVLGQINGDAVKVMMAKDLLPFPFVASSLRDSAGKCSK